MVGRGKEGYASTSFVFLNAEDGLSSEEQSAAAHIEQTEH